MWFCTFSTFFFGLLLSQPLAPHSLNNPAQQPGRGPGMWSWRDFPFACALKSEYVGIWVPLGLYNSEKHLGFKNPNTSICYGSKAHALVDKDAVLQLTPLVESEGGVEGGGGGEVGLMCSLLCPSSFDNGSGQLTVPFLKHMGNIRRLLLPARPKPSAPVRAEECTFHRSIFSAGELTDLEREGAFPEATLGKCGAPVHPKALPVWKEAAFRRGEHAACPSAWASPFLPSLCTAGRFGATHTCLAGAQPSQEEVPTGPCPALRGACTRNLALSHQEVSTPPRKGADFFSIPFLLFRRLRTWLRLVAFFLWDLIREEEQWIHILINSSESKIHQKCQSGAGQRFISPTVPALTAANTTHLGRWTRENTQWGTGSSSSATVHQWQRASNWMRNVTNYLHIFIKASFSIFGISLQAVPDAVPGVRGLHRCFVRRERGFKLSWLHQKAWKSLCAPKAPISRRYKKLCGGSMCLIILNF